jgi:L-rhamnose isomerase/sugar isomerase
MEILDRLRRLQIETPSWGYGNSGTRFHVYPWPGAARNVHERIADAALVHKLTGCCPSVALHIPWDEVEDYGELRREAEDQGIRIGGINPNSFHDDRYVLGSLCHPDPEVRALALEHCRECVEVARETGSPLISLWLADGTNYPGQDNLRDRYRRLAGGLEQLYAMLTPGLRLLVEYKFFEPGFYSTDLPDWGTAALMCRRLGPQAKVLVDLGHHPQGTNVEQIVAMLLEEDLLGGFHFNNRKYADDDLIVGSVNPLELFLIFCELAAGDGALPRLTIDQAHNVEAKVEAMVLSVVNLQESYVKALIVDREALEDAQRRGDVLGGHETLLDAYRTDVRPLCAKVREEQGAAADPVGALRTGTYVDKIVGERGAAASVAGGWGR